MTELIPIERQRQDDHSALFLAVEEAPLASSTKGIYRGALLRMVEEGVDYRDAFAVRTYGQTLTEHQKLALRSALRHVKERELWLLNANATPDSEAVISAVERRWNAIWKAIRTSQTKGTKKHQWLSAQELEDLIDSCGADLRGRRDALVIWLLGDCGLRRAEAAGVRYEDITYQEGAPVLHVIGKGERLRYVPLHSAALRLAKDLETQHGGVFLLKAIDAHGHVRDGITGRALTNIVRARGEVIGRVNLAPHDLRRTFAQVRRRAGVDVEEIRRLLGHSSISTTQRYLGDLEPATIQREFIKISE